MSNPFLGEIRMVAFNFAPVGWALCNGQILPISQNVALFDILGTTYGGDGQKTFALPNLQGCVPIHMGTNTSGTPYIIGEQGGAENVTLTLAELPPHNHPVNCVNSGGTQASPAGGYPAIESTGTSLDYSNGPSSGQMSSSMIANTGGGDPFSVQQPYLCVNFVIALSGIFPSRS
jgi:microcystin-dependent protein